MFRRKYNCNSSGTIQERPDIFLVDYICHAHPKPQDATPRDRADIARCMTFFSEMSKNSTNKEMEIEYKAAAAEDRELLRMLRKADAALEKEECESDVSRKKRRLTAVM